MTNTTTVNDSSTAGSGFSIAAVMLAGIAFVGRAAAFFTAGRSSLTYLLVLLGVAIAARMFALRAPKGFGHSLVEVTSVRLAKRIATMQIVIGAALVLMTLM